MRQMDGREDMKIAVIGTGWAANRHLTSLITQADIEIVGHVSPRLKSLEAATRHWGGRGYTTVDELLAYEAVDAAWITVPPAEHGEIEDAFLEKGIPVFIEKPLSADRQTGEKIWVEIQKKGVIAAVGYHLRAMDTLPEVRKHLEEKPVRMLQAAYHDSIPSAVWWRHQRTSGGQIVEQATHLFDLARFLVGEAQVLEASASAYTHPDYPDADVANVSAALLSFTGGIPGVFSATSLLSGPAEVYLKLICDGLLITITEKDVTFETEKETRAVRMGNDPFLSENRAFLEAIQRNDPRLLLSSYEDALKTHALCHAVLERCQKRIK
jgi:myo-inositol 2-dehydrogenase / D-chiro-inositol 1-dehydrogenase